MLNVVHDWDLGIAGENEVAVHAVDCEVRGDGPLRSREALCDYGAAVDASRAWWVPKRACVGEHVLEIERLGLRRVERVVMWKLTGPMALSCVNSNTFSMADFEGSRGGGFTSVGWSAIVEEDVEKGGCAQGGAQYRRRQGNENGVVVFEVINEI